MWWGEQAAVRVGEHRQAVVNTFLPALAASLLELLLRSRQPGIRFGRPGCRAKALPGQDTCLFAQETGNSGRRPSDQAIGRLVGR